MDIGHTDLKKRDAGTLAERPTVHPSSLADWRTTGFYLWIIHAIVDVVLAEHQLVQSDGCGSACLPSLLFSAALPLDVEYTTLKPFWTCCSRHNECGSVRYCCAVDCVQKASSWRESVLSNIKTTGKN